MKKYFIILCLISCSPNHSEISEQKIANNTFIENLINYQYSLIELDENDFNKLNDPDFSVNNFVFEELKNKKLQSSFQDSLFKFLDLGEIKEFRSLKQNNAKEIIRISKFFFAFEQYDIRIIQGIQNKNQILLESYFVKFSNNCNTLTEYLGKENNFTTDCFKLLNSEKKVIDTKTWNKLRELIIETDMVSTIYVQSKINQICDGYEYFLEYSNGSQINPNICRLVKDCPSEKTAIFLVTEKLIEIFDNK